MKSLLIFINVLTVTLSFRRPTREETTTTTPPPPPPPKCEFCGLARRVPVGPMDSTTSTNSIDRIITTHNGETEVNEYPWLVRLDCDSCGAEECAGALISDRHVLTSAECTVNHNVTHVVLGEHNHQLRFETKELHVGIKWKKENPNFNQHQNDASGGLDVGLDHNLALLELQDPVNYVKYPHICPICLPEVRPSPRLAHFLENTGFVAGWGAIEKSYEEKSHVLKEVEVQILSDQVRSYIISTSLHLFIAEILSFRTVKGLLENKNQTSKLNKR